MIKWLLQVMKCAGKTNNTDLNHKNSQNDARVKEKVVAGVHGCGEKRQKDPSLRSIGDAWVNILCIECGRRECSFPIIYLQAVSSVTPAENP